MDPQGELLIVDNFNDAAGRLLDLLLRVDSQYRDKSFFVTGFRGTGVGVSAILRATAQLLKSGRSDPVTRKHFGKIIHVDCSLWKNRRGMQKAIVEELNLGHLMPVFDKQDEDDDFRGIDVSSRVEIPSIGTEINASLRNERFLMILHYGGEEDIDLVESGVPNPDFGTYALGKLLWSSHGRFQLSWRKEGIKSNFAYFRVIELYPNLFLSCGEILLSSLHEEAAEIIGYTGMKGFNLHAVVDCFLYSLFLIEQLRGKSSSVDYGWGTHACNYWICDGILQGDRAYEVGSALYGVIRMLCSPSEVSEILAHELDGHRERWISISSNQLEEKDISKVPVNASSYFLTFGGDGRLQLPDDLFQLANNMRVLKLCNCSFDFASPPFRCCQNLRFLWLDHCTGTNTGEQKSGGPCFPNLLVLDMRFTDFFWLAENVGLMTNLREVNTKGVSWRTISHAWKILQNLQKLRVTESLDVITVDTCSSIDMKNLELLDFSGNIHMESLPAMSSAGNLKMLVLDGCSSLQHVALQGAAPLLESFSFDGYGPAEKWTHPIQLPKKELRPKSGIALFQEPKVRRISLQGCARLRNVFLRALPNLGELDLSSTAVQTLDLGAMNVPRLKKLFLLGCEKLRSLLWAKKAIISLQALHVDTRGKTGSVVSFGEQRSSVSEVLMAFTDGRFVWSVIKGLYRASYRSSVHLHISSKIHTQVNITKCIEEIGPSKEGLVPIGPFLSYMDIVRNKDIVTRSSMVWDHRQLYPLGVHIEIGEGSHHSESMGDSQDFKLFIQNRVKSLHVHDNISITAIIPGSEVFWKYLEWCHVERCPKLHTLFPIWAASVSFQSIQIFSASDLLMAYCIWGRCNEENLNSFQQLQHIYLHNCPRLVFVLPISLEVPNLETIQIAYCHNLQHIFPLNNDEDAQRTSDVMFERLKHIRLYHLHRLEQICEARLIAPALETISLRDCWGLRRLPSVSRQVPNPVVDCEKDWWDRLEWDGSEDNHEPSLFETRHSAYYKKTLPRVSVLR